MRKSVIVSALVLAVVAAFAAAAAGQEGGRFEGKVVTVSVFKNGYGFFRVEGTGRVTDGKVEISPLPAASLGTWWFYTRRDGVTIGQVTAAQREISKSRPALSIMEVIAANVGSRARVATEYGTYEGVLMPNMPAADARLENAEAAAYARRTPFGAGSASGPGRDVTLKTDEGVMSIRGSDIRTISVTSGTNDLAEKEKQGYVTLVLSGNAGRSVPMGYQFLEKGIRWIPSYRIDLTDEKTAALVLQGEVVNDIQELDSATLQLVVGVPNFLAGGALSPLAYVAEMPRLSMFFPQPQGQGERNRDVYYFSNAAWSQSVSSLEAGGFSGGLAGMAPMASEFAAGPEISSEGVSDLFYYTKENVTLHADERASLTLLSAQVAYRDIYKWTVADKTLKNRREYERVYERWVDSGFGGGNVSRDMAAKLAEMNRQDIAEHYVRLENTSGKPLTSGPALLFSKGSILAQDEVKYTPAGGTVDVRITSAPDIKVSQKEKEVDRKRNALTSDGREYDLVLVKSTMSVKNFKKETVHVVVTKPFDGTASETTDGATVTTDTSELASVNPRTVVEWEFDLEPDVSKELMCSYSTYATTR